LIPAGFGVSDALLASAAEVSFWHNAGQKQLLIIGLSRGAQQAWLELTANTDELMQQVLGKLKCGKDSPNNSTDAGDSEE
jgi:hypothetical protein